MQIRLKNKISPAVPTPSLWQSRLARRLVVVFLLVAAVPVLIALVLVGRIGKGLILSTGQTMEQINANTVSEAGLDFERLGRTALSHSSERVASLSVHDSRVAAQQAQHDQAEALALTAGDLSRITSGSITRAMHQSLATNQEILGRVSHDADSLFARSAEQTAQHSAGRVEQVMSVQIRARMQERAQELADRVSSHVQAHLDYLALSAEMLDPRTESAERQKPVLDALVRRYPMLREVVVMDAGGREIAASAPDRLIPTSELTNRVDTTYFRAARADRDYVEITRGENPGMAPVLRLAVPVELYRGHVIGVLSATLALDDLWDEIRAVRVGPSGFATVTDAQGQALLPHVSVGTLMSTSAEVPRLHWKIIVAQPRAEVMAPIEALRRDILRGTDAALAQMHNHIQTSSQTASTALRTNSLHLRAQATVEVKRRTQQVFRHLAGRTARQSHTDIQRMQTAIGQQLLIAQGTNSRHMILAASAASKELADRMASLSSRALKRAGTRFGVFTFTGVGLASLLSCVAALLLAARLVGPLVRLAQGTRDIAAGNLERRVDERAPDEIGDLAVAFNHMAESLQQSRAELSQTEAQLVQSAKLASLGTLSAGVAHELNQPVAIVRGIAQQIQDDPLLPPDLREDLVLIEGQTGRMMKIIKHLRTFCRVGSAEMTEINPYQILQECFILIEAQLTASNVAFQLDLEGEPPMVKGDANELEQVFLNLITNARDAMADQPDAVLTIRGRAREGQCVLEFHDNGPGVPAHVLARIFDPFFTTKEAGKGTGLGLSISHGIVEKHGGALSVHNEGGAVFTMKLPSLSDAAEAARPCAKAA